MRDLVFAFGVLISWIGFGALAFAIFQIGRSVANKARIGSALIKGAFGIAGILVGSILAVPASVEGPPAVRIPIFWAILPFSGWAILVCLLMAIYNVLNISSSILEERNQRLNKTMLFGLGALGFAFLFIRDTERTQRIVKGAIPLPIGTAIIIAAVIFGLAFLLGFAADRVKSRQLARTTLIQIALLGGSILFSIPFLYLLSTSFKEDRDMASPKGMIWIPKVQRTADYFNPKDPLYESSLNGRRVEAVLIDRNGDNVRLDVVRPFSLRGAIVETKASELKEIPRQAPLVSAKVEGIRVEGQVIEDMEDGRKRVLLTTPKAFAQKQMVFLPDEVEPIRDVGLRYQNYTEALEFMPPETKNGLVYLRNTLVIVVMSIVGTILSSSIVAYAFSRMRFPWRDQLFSVLLATMMLPGAVTMMPKFLIFRTLGWIDTLYPLWAPAFFGSAFNIFMLRQFFKGIPMELEDAAKMDGCTYLKTFWSIMLPQIMPALSVIFIWTFTAAWNDFQGPLIYINSPENMPLSYALQLFMGERSSEPGLFMAFATMTVVPVIILFFLMQRYFIEGVTLSGLGGR